MNLFKTSILREGAVHIVILIVEYGMLLTAIFVKMKYEASRKAPSSLVGIELKYLTGWYFLTKQLSAYIHLLIYNFNEDCGKLQIPRVLIVFRILWDKK